jgi:hypothetical protein
MNDKAYTQDELKEAARFACERTEADFLLTEEEPIGNRIFTRDISRGEAIAYLSASNLKSVSYIKNTEAYKCYLTDWAMLVFQGLPPQVYIDHIAVEQASIPVVSTAPKKARVRL